jgi:hypothetical protein
MLPAANVLVICPLTKTGFGLTNRFSAVFLAWSSQQAGWSLPA